MRNDERFEIERAFDLLPHVVGASWASIWFRMNGIKNPTREEFRNKTIEYFEKLEIIFNSYERENQADFADICKYIKFRKNKEYAKIKSGENNEIEKRYERYVDYG